MRPALIIEEYNRIVPVSYTHLDVYKRQDGSAANGKYKEFLTVDVFDSQANYQGIQSGWFAKIVKDKFNICLLYTSRCV